MQDVLLVVAVVANAYSLFWLLGFRRRDSKYKKCASCAAYLLVIALGGKVIDFLIAHNVATYADVFLSVVVAAMVHRSKGNVAILLRDDLCRFKL